MDSVERKENQSTFWQRVKVVVAFPFKVLWLLVKVAGVLLLVGVLTTVGYCVYRSGQPMVVPEAQGMTYREFYKDRFESWKKLDERKYATGKDKSGHACVISQMLFGIPIVIPRSAIGATIVAIYPESDFARNEHNHDSLLYRNIPIDKKGEWRNFLPLFWEAVERESWTWWVIRDGKSKACPALPVNYPDTAIP